MNRYPMKLIPVCKNLLWGGYKLSKIYGKGRRDEKTAESWELTVRRDGMSLIANGCFEGMALEQLIRNDSGVVGNNCALGAFPLLVKFIDASEDLSVQVHPDNDYAALHESDSGKNELWYVVDAEDNAEIVYGLKSDITDEAFESAVINEDFSPVLNKIKVKKGDVFFIPSGQVHAICHGVLIAEIQQNSNITYRIYDYNRTGSDGKKRELHVRKALDVVKNYTDDYIKNIQFCGKADRRPSVEGGNVICDCEHFRVTSITLSSKAGHCEFTVDENSFAFLLFTDAENVSVSCSDTTVGVFSGDGIFIPAGSGKIYVNGKCHVLLSEC